jgi:hypothetical protein
LADPPWHCRAGGCATATEGISVSACATLLGVLVVMIMVLRAAETGQECLAIGWLHR